MKASLLHEGQSARIDAISLPHGEKTRIMEMGVIPGTRMRMFKRMGKQSIVQVMGYTRLGLSDEILSGIEVTV